MKARFMVIMAPVIAVLGIAIESSHAQSAPTLTTEAARMDRIADSLGGAQVIDKISAEFSSFLGPDAKAIVTGLRNGTPMTLTTTTAGSTPGAAPQTTTTTITPPTGKMGFGNVFIALALAKQQLSQVGITQPTPADLQAALLGGSVATGNGTTTTATTLSGILTMRSQSMGWGQIAHALNLKLGSVVSGLKAANHSLVVRAASPAGSGVVNAGGQPVDSSESGIVTGSGRSTVKPGKRSGSTSSSEEGIVTGSGRPIGSSHGISTGRGEAYGISGDGRPGLGYGYGKGHSK